MSLAFSPKWTANEHAVIDYSKLRASEATAYSSETPMHMRQLVEFIMAEFSAKKLRVLDLTAHVGGFTLPWAAQFPRHHVTAVERDARNFENLKYNIDILKLRNVTAVHADSSEYIKALKTNQFDFVYFDPPWGGPNYRFKTRLNLYLGRMSAADVIKYIFDHQIAQWAFLKVPNNFDFATLDFPHLVRPVAGLKQAPDYLFVSVQLQAKKKIARKKKT